MRVPPGAVNTSAALVLLADVALAGADRPIELPLQELSMVTPLSATALQAAFGHTLPAAAHV